MKSYRKTFLRLALPFAALIFLLAVQPAALGAEMSSGQKLVSDAWEAHNGGKDDVAIKILRRIVEEKLCTDNEPEVKDSPVDCLSAARFFLAHIYKKRERYQEALALYEAAAISPKDDKWCGAAAYQRGEVYEKLGQPRNALKFYDDAVNCLADDKEWSNLPYVPPIGKRASYPYISFYEEIQKRRIRLADFLQDTGKVVDLAKTYHYISPSNQSVALIYANALEKEGMAQEAAAVRKYQTEINDGISQWEKVNAPNWSNPKSVEQYWKNRLAMYKNALKASTALGLKGYEDYLIAVIRAQQSQIDEAAEQKDKARQNAELQRMREENSRRFQEESDRAAAENERRKNEEYQKILDVLMKGGKP